MFNADSYLHSAAAPQLLVNGTTYTGKLISFDQVLKFQQRLQEEGDVGKNSPQIIRELCEAIDIPADVLLSLPPGAVLGALQDFFGCLLGALPAQQMTVSPTLPGS